MQQSRAVLDHSVDDAVDARRDGGNAAGGRFDDHRAESFAIARKAQDVGGGHHGLGPAGEFKDPDAIRVASAGDGDSAPQPGLVGADDQQMHIVSLFRNRVKRRCEVEDAFVDGEPPHEQHQNVARRNFEIRTNSLSRGRVGPEPRRIDAAHRALAEHSQRRSTRDTFTNQEVALRRTVGEHDRRGASDQPIARAKHRPR